MSDLIVRVARRCAGRPLPYLVLVFALLLWLISFSPFWFSEDSITRAYGTGTLDLQFGADAERAHVTLDQLGAAGRADYDGFQVVDLFFPASYALALSGLIWWGWHGDRHRWVTALAAVPLVGAALDYLENALVRTALWTYPDLPDGLLDVSTTVTSTKIALSYVSQAAVVLGLVVAAVRRVRRAGVPGSRRAGPRSARTGPGRTSDS